MTTTNNTAIGYSLETVPGVINTNPTFQLIPTTGGKPTATTKKAVSTAIRDDRQQNGIAVVGLDVAGDINFELSQIPFADLLVSLMRGTEYNGLAASATDIAASNGPSAFTSTSTDFVASGFVVGMRIRTIGFATPANNDTWAVTAVAVNQLDVVLASDGATAPTTEAAGASVSLQGDLIDSGALDPDTYTFLYRVQNLVATGYFYYPGVQIGKLQLTVPTEGLVTGVLSLMGLSETATTTAAVGQTVTPEQDYRILNGASNIEELSFSGLPDDCFSELTISIDNTLMAAKCIRTLGTNGIAANTINVTGTASVYFGDLASYNDYKNDTAFSWTIFWKDEDGKGIGFTFPYCKWETLDTPRAGKDQFLMLSGTWRATRDPVTGVTVRLLRHE